jgi:ribonuclease HII
LDLFEHDARLRAQGHEPLAGLDEAGRGALAGPVVAAAVVLPGGAKVEGLKDSKLLSPRQRHRLLHKLLQVALDVGVGLAHPEEIERLNVLGATRLAMQRALENLTLRPALLLIDALRLPQVRCPQMSLLKGELKSASIAAASVLAKCARDSIMLHYHGLWPQYGFDRHKGYCSRAHLQALGVHGPCPVHRRGFRPVQSLQPLF